MTIEERKAEVILDHASGCLVGLAAGDALGGPVEGLSREEISRRYTRLKEMVGGGSLDLDPGETTDDTAQTIAMAESIAERGRLDPADIAGRFSMWYRHRPRGVGAHTAAVMEKITGGEDWEQASLEVQAANPASAGNGSLMRCAPVALLDHAMTPVLIEDSRLSSRITHPHAECQWSCALVNLIIAELLAGAEPRRAVDNALATCAHRGDVAFQVLVRVKRASQFDASSLSPTGYVLDTLECSIWAFLRYEAFEDSVVAAVNLGGDADTIGAVTGALAGAAYGLHSIPERWLIHLSHRERLQQLSRALIELN